MSKEIEIAYCGLYCGQCIIRNGKISEKSEQLLEIFKTDDCKKLVDGLPKFFPEIHIESNEYETCIKFLQTMKFLDCNEVCKKTGGTSKCKIKNCCIEKKLDGCWLCENFENCEILDSLTPIHKRANIKNIKTIRENGISSFLKGEKYW